MAKISVNPNSANNQWFFNLADNSGGLDNQNGGSTVFGRVLNQNSQTVLDAISVIPIYNFGSPFTQLPLVNYVSGSVVNSNFVTVISITQVANKTTQSDYDSDGKADLSVFRPSNQVWYQMNSTAGFTAQSWGLASDKLAPADYDGDNKTDLAVWREDANNPDFSYFYIFQPSTNSLRIAQFGRIGDNPSLSADWDGDGKADPTVYRDGANAGNGQSYFYYQPSAQPSVKFAAVPWEISGDLPVRGDFDGNGKQDAAVFRPSNGVWYIQQSSNNQLKAESWGIAGDKLIAADYDGDGKTDVAVLRGTNWYLKQSSDAAFKAYDWGIATDKAVPADYDGDGKADIAVYRDGNWYIIQSSNSQISYGAFGQTGDLPISLNY